MATRTWNGSVSNDWTDADNWDGGVVPVDGDDIFMPNSAANALYLTPLIDTLTLASIDCESSDALPITLGGNPSSADYPIPLNVTGTVNLPSVSFIWGGAFTGAVNMATACWAWGGDFMGGLTMGPTAVVLGISFPDGFPPAAGTPVDHIEFTRDASPTPLTTDTVDSGDTATYHAQAFDADDAPLGDPADLAVTGTGGTVTFAPGIYTVNLG